MVQLKSFKYIEQDGGEDEGLQRQRQERQHEEVKQQHQQQQSLSSPSASSQSIGSANADSVVGGNLTIEETSTNEDNGEQDQEQEQEQEQESTLASSEEYQMARLDLTEGEELDSTEADGINVKIGPNNNADDNNQQERLAISRPNGVNIKQPNSVRQQFYVSRQHAGSPMLLHHSASSGSLVKQASPAIPRQNRSNSIGTLKYQQQQMQPCDSQPSLASGHQKVNQFEIRWQNINLMASKSRLPRLPRLISENPIYKLFYGTDRSESAARSPSFPYKHPVSPPIRHRLNYLPSVSETLELQTPPIRPELQSGATQPFVSNSGNNSNHFRPILTNVSGSVSSGQLTAILGPSGVGKTSLLNSLTGRNTLDGTGRVSLIEAGASKRMSVVTVPQNDVLPGKLTTIEDLTFTSKLKNPEANFNHQRNIDRIVKHLQMEKFLHNRIDKLSGGEARRLSIGRELLQSPDIVILDEPTSGLDANTCKKIITALRDIVEHSENISDRPMAIIITIHQPQQEVLNLFHRVYVMAVGGRTIYEGSPCNMLRTLLDYSSLSRVCQTDQLNENPAIVALEVASGEYGSQVIGELALHHESQVYDEYGYLADSSPYSTPLSVRHPRKSPLSVSPRFELPHRARLNSIGSGDSIGRPTPRSLRKQHHQQQQQFDKISNITSISYASTWDADLPEPESRLKVDKRLRRSVVTKSDFISHTLTLMRRCWLLTTRDLFLMSIRFLGFLLVAGGMVQIFSHALDPNENQCPVYESEVDDVISYIRSSKERLLNLRSVLQQASSTHLFFFHLLLCTTIVSSALAGLLFPIQMRMFIREYKNGWYSPASFITSTTLAELPVDMIGPTLTLLISYPLCNQPTSDYYWREIGYTLVVILCTLICKSQAQIVGAFLMDSVENSVFLSCVVVTPPALLSGVAVRISAMSLPLQWLSYGSFLRYGFESLLLLRYGYGICPCDSDLIGGYPTRITANAIPPQLDNLARGFLELSNSEGSNQTIAVNATDLLNETSITTTPISIAAATDDDEHANLFVEFLRLITEASNMFVASPQELGDCNKYRSLYLIDMNVDDRILTKWFLIMLLMFVISRFITYFAVKTVIMMRRK